LGSPHAHCRPTARAARRGGPLRSRAPTMVPNLGLDR